MRCEWCSTNAQAEWWADTIYGPLSWCCNSCLLRVGKKDEHGNFIAMTACDRMAQLHPQNAQSCGSQ